MSASLGASLEIRTMAYLAAEPIPFFWPMRTFIHHNPLYGLEHLPFEEAVALGSKLFHGRGYLSRTQYQEYLEAGDVDAATLKVGIAEALADRPPVPGIDLDRWVWELLAVSKDPGDLRASLAQAADVREGLSGATPASPRSPITVEELAAQLQHDLLGERPVHEALDGLFGTRMGEELDSIVIKTCLDFFDEGQSTWSMPGREQGLFRAWRNLALHNVPLERHARQMRRILAEADTPEGVILHVLSELEIPEEHWIGYFTRELSRMHGWSGFIRWRSSAKRYHWNRTYPGDLVDLLAIRSAVALALIQTSRQRDLATRSALTAALRERPAEMYLRRELFGGRVLPVMAAKVERALRRSSPTEIAGVFAQYVSAKRRHEGRQLAARLRDLADQVGQRGALDALDLEQLQSLLETLTTCQGQQGLLWLKAMEARAMTRLLDDLVLTPPEEGDRRAFAQALFCIDTRSERIRRQLEASGDYQTFGIAGFFGVPVSFIELGKGSENHLSPVIVTPQNVVLEIAATELAEDPVSVVLGEAVHQLKENVVTPFVTVEAIGLLFGFDMVGKTLAPRVYQNWRKRLDPVRPRTHLLLDKLDRNQADSIVRAVQRGVILRAVEREIGVDPEVVTDGIIRELRECALGHGSDLTECRAHLGLSDDQLDAFVRRLSSDYEINASYGGSQLDRLARIGFTLDEQVNYAGQALRAIGLTEDFSRFVLITGHGSTSANNPYESALDCGACGGNHGLVNARVLAQMANKPQVRRRLRKQGIDIPDDTWFVPALHNTTTDEVELLDLELMPPAHLVYLDRLRQGLTAASRRCAQERIPTLGLDFYRSSRRAAAPAVAQRNSMDWSQVRPEWGLARNAYFIIGGRDLTRGSNLEGRAFLHSYDYRIDPKRRLLENILAGPLVVGQWINMEHYFSTVDNDVFGSGSKVNQNVSGRFGVMSGNISDLRTGLPAQTVLKDGKPYHEPLRLITVIEAPLEHARAAVEGVIAVRQLVANEWVRLLVVDPTTSTVHLFENGSWHEHSRLASAGQVSIEEGSADGRN